MTAADKLRALAGVATPGPWYWEPGSPLIHARVGTEGHRRGVGDFAFAYLPVADQSRANADAAFIATMDPPFALAIADLLDAARLHVGLGEPPGGGTWCEECAREWPCRIAKARDAIEKLIG